MERQAASQRLCLSFRCSLFPTFRPGTIDLTTDANEVVGYAANHGPQQSNTPRGWPSWRILSADKLWCVAEASLLGASRTYVGSGLQAEGVPV